MKKIVVTLIILVTTLIVALTANATEVCMDGKNVYFDNSTGYPFVSGGRTLVPLRATMESFGAQVEWEQDTQTAVVRKGTTWVRCKVGEACIYRNNVKIPNDATAVISNGRTYLPIRVVLEAFGATVSWDGNVNVTSPGAGNLIYTIENAQSVTTNYWGIWNEALSLKSSGQYAPAIDKIKSISSVFIQKNQSSSNAMLYKHLGECYSSLGDYVSAAECFKRESYYWSITPGMSESMIDATRRATLITADSQIFIKSSDDTFDASNWFGVDYEPKRGIYPGAYAEGDTSIYNPYDPSRFYMDTYSGLVGKNVGAYLLYLPYGSNLSTYQSHIDYASSKGKLVQIALEPHYGISSVNSTDGYLKRLASDMEASGCPMILRFAGEMNDLSAPWYTSDANLYIQKFREVANIFHTYAPSVPIIWAPNFYPSETINQYYPGDEYVDYVGVSSYKVYQGITDPLGQGVDRSRWSNQLDFIYSQYGHKKPIIIVESGSSYVNYDTGADLTGFASEQLSDFYTYLPIKYPNVKMCFHYDANDRNYRFLLSGNQSYLNTYRQSISNPYYLSDINQSDSFFSYYELGNNVNIKAEYTQLTSYITSPVKNVAYVKYFINGVDLGVAYGIPYTVNADFSSYKGQKINITIKAYDANYMEITSQTVFVNVI